MKNNFTEDGFSIYSEFRDVIYVPKISEKGKIGTNLKIEKKNVNNFTNMNNENMNPKLDVRGIYLKIIPESKFNYKNYI